MRGWHGKDGKGITIIRQVNEDGDETLVICDELFHKKREYRDSTIITVDSDGNYCIKNNDGKYLVLHPDGTVSNTFNLARNSSLLDHNRTISDNGYGLMKSDGTVLIAPQYKMIGSEYNGLCQACNDPEYSSSMEYIYTAGYLDFNGDWILQGRYYTKRESELPGRNLVLKGDSRTYFFYDMKHYVEDLHEGGDYYRHRPAKLITEDDLYGPYYKYLNNTAYDKMARRLWGDMNLIYGSRSEGENLWSILISNMKQGAVKSFINAMVCDFSGEYYNKHNLEEMMALSYLQEASENPAIMSQVVSDVNKFVKWSDRGVKIIESGFENISEKKELAEMLECDSIVDFGYTEYDLYEIIRDTESNWKTINNVFEKAGYTVNVAEVVTTIVISQYVGAELTERVMNAVERDSELYRGLELVRQKQDYPAEMLVMELLDDDLFSKITGTLTSEGISRLASLCASTGGIKIGMATTVASIGYYCIGSLCDHFFANSDEIISAFISLSNNVTLNNALSEMRQEMADNGSGAGFKEDYTVTYQIYMISLKKGVEALLKVAKHDENREKLEKDYAELSKYLSYERYIDSCLENANAAINYTVEDGKANIIKYQSRSIANEVMASADTSEPVFIDIPEEVDGYPVGFVSEAAFKNNGRIAGVYVPESVTGIGSNAFEGCANLSEVFLEEGVASLGDKVFLNCSSLRAVELPDSVHSLGTAVFEGTDGVVVSANDTSVIDQYAADSTDGVTVHKLPAPLKKIAIVQPADKQSYTMSEIADLDNLSADSGYGAADLTGLELKATYEDGTEETVTEGIIGVFEEKKLGENTVTVLYRDQSASFKVNVTADECAYEIAYVDEYGKEIADRQKGTAMAGTSVAVSGPEIEGYKLVSEPREETIGASNLFTVEYEIIPKPTLYDAKVSLSAENFAYSGEEICPEVTVTYDGKPLAQGTDYTVEYESNVEPGTALAVVYGAGKYGGMAFCEFTIDKLANTMTAKGKTAKVKFSKLKKKTQTVTAKKAFTVRSAVGTVSCKMAQQNKKAKKKITIGKTGKITVKKGLKKGKYKIKVKVTAAGDERYAPLSKTVTVTIRVT